MADDDDQDRDRDRAGRPDVVDLRGWAATARTAEATGGRRRERWLREQAGSDATLAAVLLDMAESGLRFTLTTAGGRRHAGPLVQVGADFCAVASAADRITYVPFAALAMLGPAASASPAAPASRPAGQRRHPAGGPPPPSLVAALAGLSDDRPEVVVVAGSAPGTTVSGELRAVGDDVLVVWPAGASAPSYVPVASLYELSLRVSG